MSWEDALQSNLFSKYKECSLEKIENIHNFAENSPAKDNLQLKY